MTYIYTGHIRTRMRARKISQSEIEEALANIETRYSTPKDSTCIVGVTAGGRKIKVWIVGTDWPPSGPWILKSAAGKDEEDDF